MSLFRSVLQGRPLTRNEYDLPMYNPEPQAFPPPPVTASYYAPTMEREESPAGKPAGGEAPLSDDMVIIQRRDRFLRQKLQELVNAQADGLMAALQGTSTADDEESLDTPTQTTYSLRSNNVSPSPFAQRRKKVGLAAARRGIWKTVIQFADLKIEEDSILRDELHSNQDILEQLGVWEKKQAGLKEKINNIENEDTGAKTETLKEEASRLEGEIQDMEIRLAQMKTRHRQLVNEIADVENSVQSKLSSYKNSLDLLEREVKRFLESPPGKEERSAAESPFFSLPASRRTLEMAKEHWQNDSTALKKQRRAARRERIAYEEGAVVWDQVMTEITQFEKFFQRELARLTGQPAANKGKARVEAATPIEILQRMETLSHFLEEKLEYAFKKEWRLLQVCIESELGSLEQGMKMLEQTFGISHETEKAPDGSQDADSEGETEEPSIQSSTKDLFSSAAEGLGNGALSHSAALRKSMYEDDEPDPDLLFTKREDDTE